MTKLDFKASSLLNSLELTKSLTISFKVI